MANAATFTTDSARRIAAAVRKVEGQPANLVGDPARRTSPVDTRFWAKIGEDGYAEEGGYGWTRLESVNGVLTETDTTGVNAQEVNGSPDVPGNTVVRMAFAGYDVDGDAVYKFQYTAAGGGGGPDFAKHFDVQHTTTGTTLWDRDLRGETFAVVASFTTGTSYATWKASAPRADWPIAWTIGSEWTGGSEVIGGIQGLELYIDSTTGFLRLRDTTGTSFPVQLRIAIWLGAGNPEPIVI